MTSEFFFAGTAKDTKDTNNHVVEQRHELFYDLQPTRVRTRTFRLLAVVRVYGEIRVCIFKRENRSFPPGNNAENVRVRRDITI